MAVCSSCGSRLGFFASLTGSVCSECKLRVQNERTQAQHDYVLLLDQMASSRALTSDGAHKLSKLAKSGAFEPDALRRLHASTITAMADRMLADDVLTLAEEQEFLAMIDALGVKNLQLEYPAILSRLIIARCNDGRLPSVKNPKLLTKRDEVVHIETTAALMKEQAIREYQAGSKGVSFRVMKGVRYRVGASRGRMVQVGTRIVIADTGSISVTSQRVVFLGDRTTIDIPYSRLIGMNLYSDGITFNISNRKTAPTLKLDDPDVVTAVINTAMQSLS